MNVPVAQPTLEFKMNVENLTTSNIIEKIGPPAKRSKEWQHGKDVVSWHRELFNREAKKEFEYPENKYTSKGIVISGGGSYAHLAYVAINILREVGCCLPIELWYNGLAEMSPLTIKEFEAIGSVRCFDAKKCDYTPRILNGWEMKPYSIINSSFEEVLLIDADNIVARDPAYLFHDVEYLEHGAIFWPDLPIGKIWIPPDSWEAAGIDANNRGKPAFESGQLLINKKKCWKSLHLAMHLNEYSDFWYEYVYGDKDTFKLAWHKNRQSYAIPARSKWKSPAIIQPDLQNRDLFYHCCQGKKQIKSGKAIMCLPSHVRDRVVEFGKQYNKGAEKADALTSRTAFETFCKQRSIGVQMSNNKTLTRIFGSTLMFCDSSAANFTPHIVRDGYWEAWISLFLLRTIKDDWTVLNIGANVGYYTLLLAPFVKRMIAVEPNPRCVELLKQSASENSYGNVNIIPGALSNKDRVDFFIPNENNVCGNIFSYGQPVATVNGYTLDKLIDLIGEYPDLIICDTEGAEPFIDDVSTRILFEVEHSRNYPKEWSLVNTPNLRHVNYDSQLKYISIGQIMEDKSRSYMCWVDKTIENEVPKEINEWLSATVN